MPAMPSMLSSSLALLLVLLFSSSHAAVLAKAGCTNNDVSCFATPGAAFRTRTCQQTSTMIASPSKWHQIAPGPFVGPPALEYGSKSFASSKRCNDDDRDDGMDARGLEDLQESNQSSKKRFSLRFRQRLRKVAKVTSLALIHFTVLRLRPGSAEAAPGTVHDAAPAPQVSPARRASVVRMMDDDRRVVQCSIKPGAIQAEDGTWTDPTEREETGTLLEDFGGTATSDDAADTSPSPKKLSRKERRALRRQQRQKDKQWKEYGDDEEDDEEDFASGDGNLLSDGVGAAAAAAPGMGGPPGTRQGGYMTRPPGATGISEKAKSNIQAKVILIAGGGYALTCFGYEGWQWNKEQKKVETSIEILGEQAKELGLKLENNATATDEEIADELRNITDTSEEDDEGSEDNGDGGDDDDDDDDDEPEPPRRRPRKPIRPSPDDDDDDDYGGGRGGAGDGRPSADDLDRLNKMFKKS